MNNSVIIKGMQSGLMIVLDKNLPYEELRKDIIEKFKSTSNFLGKADVAVCFEGRDLSNEEMADVIGIIHDVSDLNIVCVLYDDPIKEAHFAQSIEDKLLELSENTASFHKGSIRSGQTFDAKAGVIILGDVLAGATVNSSGNVIVIGNIEGTVNAGLNGNKRAFIFALDMKPTQLKIANYSYQAPATSNGKLKFGHTKKKSSALIAYVELGKLTISEITKEVIHELRIK